MCRKRKKDKWDKALEGFFAYTQKVVGVICLKEEGRQRESNREKTLKETKDSESIAIKSKKIPL